MLEGIFEHCTREGDNFRPLLFDFSWIGQDNGIVNHRLLLTAAAAGFAAKVGGSEIVTNIVIDHDTFERYATQFFGGRAPRPTIIFDPDLPNEDPPRR